MRLLVLGGTKFLGRALTETALEQGHAITLFNRGITAPDLFPGVEKIQGNRNEGLPVFHHRRWDAVIDTSGYTPRQVRSSADALRDHVDRYVFISSISVYADFSKPGVDEGAPVEVVDEASANENSPETYGARKALCEREVEKVYPGSALNIRPGLIVGPHDPTDRFSYWVYRVARGGTVLAPGRPGRAVQFIDVRDLAEWTIRMAGEHQHGIYNATGPSQQITMGQLLETMHQVSGGEARFEWVAETFLLEKQVEPWSQIPLWVPEIDEQNGGFTQVDTRKALEAGLTFRPVSATVRDTLGWLNTRPDGQAWKAGLDGELEEELLRMWAEQHEEPRN